jgi:hypothetical protein
MKILFLLEGDREDSDQINGEVISELRINSINVDTLSKCHIDNIKLQHRVSISAIFSTALLLPEIYYYSHGMGQRKKRIKVCLQAISTLIRKIPDQYDALVSVSFVQCLGLAIAFRLKNVNVIGFQHGDYYQSRRFLKKVFEWPANCVLVWKREAVDVVHEVLKRQKRRWINTRAPSLVVSGSLLSFQRNIYTYRKDQSPVFLDSPDPKEHKNIDIIEKLAEGGLFDPPISAKIRLHPRDHLGLHTRQLLDNKGLFLKNYEDAANPLAAEVPHISINHSSGAAFTCILAGKICLFYSPEDSHLAFRPSVGCFLKNEIDKMSRLIMDLKESEQLYKDIQNQQQRELESYLGIVAPDVFIGKLISAIRSS